jgi:hypothetical protein
LDENARLGTGLSRHITHALYRVPTKIGVKTGQRLIFFSCSLQIAISWRVEGEGTQKKRIQPIHAGDKWWMFVGKGVLYPSIDPVLQSSRA